MDVSSEVVYEDEHITVIRTKYRFGAMHRKHYMVAAHYNADIDLKTGIDAGGPGDGKGVDVLASKDAIREHYQRQKDVRTLSNFVDAVLEKSEDSGDTSH